MSASKGGQTSQHVERLARGRQRQLEQEAARSSREDGSIGTDWRQQTAKKMLKDLKGSGVDEDLEMLRASWRTPSSPQKKSTIGLTHVPFGQAALEPTELNMQGDQAMRRLRVVESLRRVATAKPTPTPAHGLLSLMDARGVNSGCRLGDRESGFLLLEEDDKDSHRGRFAPRRWRGPLDNSDNEIDEDDEPRSVLALMAAVAPQRTVRRQACGQAGKSVVGAARVSDPWVDWESRWAEAFKRMDDAEVRRRRQEQQQERYEQEIDGEARRQHWEASRARQQEAAERVRARFAERQSAKRPAQPPPQPQPRNSGGTSEKQGTNGSRREDGSGGSGGGVLKDVPVPRFASFQQYDDAWNAFELKVGSGASGQTLRCEDVPWPLSMATISGATTTDDPAIAKKKLHKALLRWHPDKCERWMARVKEADRALVAERIKEVTRLILQEKSRFGC